VLVVTSGQCNLEKHRKDAWRYKQVILRAICFLSPASPPLQLFFTYTHARVPCLLSFAVRFIQTYHRWAKPGVTNIPGEDMAYSNALGYAKKEREMKVPGSNP
jgi:hypothetical protein